MPPESHPNGVEVRGLRVLRTEEDGGIAWFSAALSLIMGDVPSDSRRRVVLTVVAADGAGAVGSPPGPALARRRCYGMGHADATRARFVALVAAMSDAELARADWQDVLDHA